ncbi:Aconitate hydratase OS=Lysinibacillus sphaericus CBAM5 OX=1400869 GN=P799_10535 PE=3 SV=1 [Lysinibacillus sphaericus]
MTKIGNASALQAGEVEYERNAERYNFLKWAQTAYNNFRAVPPATGMVHQVNLELAAIFEDGTVRTYNFSSFDSR